MNNITNTYLKKLNTLITSKEGFNFCGSKIISAKRIDDILCCFFAGFPNAYKNILDIDIAQEQQGMVSIKLYKEFLKEIKTSFFINSFYIININKASKMCQDLAIALKKDFELLEEKK